MNNFFRLCWVAAAALLLGGCASATRLSIPPEEARTSFVVRHHEPAPAAFNHAELALAEAYNDLPAVLKLRQPETGTFILKPYVSYQAGGPLGPIHHARYMLKIVVAGEVVTLDFDLEREEGSGWNSYAPASEIPKIKAAFRDVAGRVAKSVRGAIE